MNKWDQSIPSIFLNHVGQLNYIFPFLILLAGLECMFLLKKDKRLGYSTRNTLQLIDACAFSLTYFHPSGVLQHSQ